MTLQCILFLQMYSSDYNNNRNKRINTNTIIYYSVHDEIILLSGLQ